MLQTFWQKLYSPRQLYRPWLIQASMASVIRSPKLAAMGVATLSGFMPVFFDPTITPTIIIPRAKLNRKNTRHFAILNRKLQKILFSVSYFYIISCYINSNSLKAQPFIIASVFIWCTILYNSERCLTKFAQLIIQTVLHTNPMSMIRFHYWLIVAKIYLTYSSLRS